MEGDARGLLAVVDLSGTSAWQQTFHGPCAHEITHMQTNIEAHIVEIYAVNAVPAVNAVHAVRTCILAYIRHAHTHNYIAICMQCTDTGTHP